MATLPVAASPEKRWSWIIGPIALVVSILLPPFTFFGLEFMSGVLWPILNHFPAYGYDLQANLSLLLPLICTPCALVACSILLWHRFVNRRPTITRGLIAVLAATFLALLVMVLGSLLILEVLFPAPLGSWIFFAVIIVANTYGRSFLYFLPFLLTAGAILARMQSHRQNTGQ